MLNTEIEIKILLNVENESKLQDFLDKNSKFISRQEQIDYYLDNPVNSFLYKNRQNVLRADTYLRVRKSDKGNSLCVKKWHFDKNENEYTHCTEYETCIENAASTLNIMQSLGFTNVTVVHKNRITYLYKDFEIAIDYIKDLGKFAEFEIKNFKTDSPVEERRRLFDLLDQIALSDTNIVTHGYVVQLWNKKNNLNLILN